MSPFTLTKLNANSSRIGSIFGVTCGVLVAFVAFFYIWRYRRDRRHSLLQDIELGRQQSHQEREEFAKEVDIARANATRIKGQDDHPLARRYETRKETKQQAMPTVTKPTRYTHFIHYFRDRTQLDSDLALQAIHTFCKVIYNQVFGI